MKIKNEKRIIKRIKQIGWEEWGTRRITTRLAENWTSGPRHFFKLFGVRFPDQIHLLRDEIGHGYLNVGQLKKLQGVLLKKLFVSSFSDLYEKKALPEFRKILRFCKDVNRQRLTTYSNRRLLNIFNDFIAREDIFINFLWTIFIFDFFLPDFLEKELRQFLIGIGQINKYDEYLKAIICPFKKPDSLMQSIEVLKSAFKIGTNFKSKEAIKEIDRLVRKYAYFPILNFDEKPVSGQYFIDEIKRINNDKNINPRNELRRINNEYQLNKRKYKEVLKVVKPNRRLKILVDAIHKISYYREYRNEVRRKYGFYIAKLYREIAKRLDLSLNSILMMSREEIRRSLYEGRAVINEKDMAERKKGYCIATIDNKPYRLFDKRAYNDLFLVLQSKIKVDEIKGVAANLGRVSGMAKIIISVAKDGYKINPSDILVTSMTNLDFVPLMAKVSAIVTDEGGITCHAAIVSRELGIPCVIGTKIATKVLKDGDLVEVDAERGIVRKL